MLLLNTRMLLIGNNLVLSRIFTQIQISVYWCFIMFKFLYTDWCIYFIWSEVCDCWIFLIIAENSSTKPGDLTWSLWSSEVGIHIFYNLEKLTVYSTSYHFSALIILGLHWEDLLWQQCWHVNAYLCFSTI